MPHPQGTDSPPRHPPDPRHGAEASPHPSPRALEADPGASSPWQVAHAYYAAKLSTLYNGRRRAGLVGVVALLTCVQLGAPGSESLLPQSQHQSDPPTVQHSVSRRRTAPSVHLCRCSPSTLAASLGGNSSLLRSPASSLCVGARALFAQSTTLTRQIRSECRHRARHGRGHALWSIRSEGRDRRGGSHAPPIRGAPARYSSRYSVKSLS